MITSSSSTAKEPPKSTAMLLVMQWFCLVGLVCFLALMVFHPIANGDLWAHAKTGEWILAHKRIPRHNLFMYTTPAAPWINHSWLTAVVFYPVLEFLGPVGVQIFQFLIVLISWAILWRLWTRMHAPYWLGIIIFAISIGASRYRLQPRPELFSAMGLSLLLYSLFCFRFTQRFPLRWLPVVVVLWTNLHGGVAFGLALLWIYVIGETVEFVWARRRAHNKRSDATSEEWIKGPATDADSVPAVASSRANPLRTEQLRSLIAIAVVCMAVSLINPFGYHYYSSFSPERMKMLSANISEWFPFMQFWRELDMGSRIVFALLVCVCALSFVIGRRNVRLSHFLIVGFAALLTWQHMRNVWCLSQVLVAVMAVHFAGGEHRPGQDPAAGSSYSPLHAWLFSRACLFKHVVAVFVLMFVILQSEYYQILHGRWPGLGLDREKLPLGAVRFIEESGLDGRMYNDVADSGYLIWRLCPQRKLFIDLLNAYDDAIFKDAYAIFWNRKPLEVLDRWRVDYCILSSAEYFSGFARQLHANPEWRLVYWDGVSLIYVRNAEKYHSIIQRYGYKLINPTHPGVRPASGTHRAYLAEVERGLRNPVQSAALYNEAGMFFINADQPARAEMHFRHALQISPYKTRALLGLAQAQYLQGKLDEAIATCRILLPLSPNRVQVWKLIGMMYARKGEWKRAQRALRRALRLAPEDEQVKETLKEVSEHFQRESE